MKKVISCILVLCFMLGAFSSFVFSTDNTYGYTLGDVDDDNTITMTDLLALRKYLLGLYGQKDINPISADADESGDVAMNDLLKLRKMLLGLDYIPENNGDKLYKVDTVSIDGRNINRYTIVVTEPENECMMYSGELLRDYINKACGVTLNVTTDESAVSGYKIKMSFDTEDNFELGTEGYRLYLDENGDMQFICGSMRGPIYSAYYFLEEIVGWRFIASNKAVLTGWWQKGPIEYLYEAENVNVDFGYDVTEVPFLEHRGVYGQGCIEGNSAALRENFMVNKEAKYGYGFGVPVDSHSHSFKSQCGLDELTEQPCFTSEEIYDQVIEHTHRVIALKNESGRYWDYVSVSPNDNNNYCTCANCKSVYEAEGCIGGAVIRFVNKCAITLDEFYPGVMLYTLAYGSSADVPKMCRPEDNVIICYCLAYGCNNHSFYEQDLCTGNERLEHVIETQYDDTSSVDNVCAMDRAKSWTELSDNVWIWYYSNATPYLLMPAPNVFNAYDDVKYLVDMGIKGIYFELAGGPYASFEMLKTHLYAKMMWNPFMSEEEFNALIDEFLMIYYGDGWQSMREVLHILDNAGNLQGCWTCNYDRPWNMYNKEYIKEQYPYLTKCLEKVREGATDDMQKRAADISVLHVYLLGLSATYEDSYVNGDETSRAKYAEEYAFLYNTIKSYGLKLRIAYDGTDSYGCLNFPSSEADIYDPMTWLYEGFTGEWQWSGSQWQ